MTRKKFLKLVSLVACGLALPIRRSQVKEPVFIKVFRGPPIPPMEIDDIERFLFKLDSVGIIEEKKDGH